MMSAAVAGTTFRPISSYTTLRDVTLARPSYVSQASRSGVRISERSIHPEADFELPTRGR